MKHRTNIFLITAAMLFLMLDSRTAISGIISGLELCIYTIIPALFPFLFLSSLLLNELSGWKSGILHPITAKLGMPLGIEGILVVGLLGGYPTGAASVASYYRQKKIDRLQAERMLGFCNNAGPAFIFGISSSIFPWYLSLVIWIIHILAAMLTAYIIQSPQKTIIIMNESTGTTASQVLNNTIRTMAVICGWIILFRMVIYVCCQYFLCSLPEVLQVIVQGILELSNGCCSLNTVTDPTIQFILFSVFISLGGICVLMQTASVAAPLSLRWYIKGKLLQCLISFIISGMAAMALFPTAHLAGGLMLLLFLGSILLLLTVYVIKNSRFLEKLAV